MDDETDRGRPATDHGGDHPILRNWTPGDLGAVDLGGEQIAEHEQLLLNWTAANRDPLVFGDADQYDPESNAETTVVFDIGPHVCPGRALTLMELRVMLE